MNSHVLKQGALRAREKPAQMGDQLRTRLAAPSFLPTSNSAFRYRHMLLPSYLDYVSRVSWADMAVSLETAAALLQMCEDRRPARVLDTGSGYSSYVLRRYAREHGAEVVSVETDPGWMDKTADYLAEMQVGDAGLMLWADFADEPQGTFGLIFHDMAGGKTREDTMPMMTELILPDGVLVFDDMQCLSHLAEARRVTAAAGRRLFSLRGATLDPIRRYASASVA